MARTEQVIKDTIAIVVEPSLLKPQTRRFITNILSKSEITQICKHLVEKNSIRSVERITIVINIDTISRLLEDLAIHEAFMNEVLLNEIKLGQFEVNEMWSFIKKTKES